MEKKVCVRFAPSPTGPLHIGGVRTALYNYLFAKKHHGKFILRIEDTDRTRFVQSAEAYILHTLQWLGIKADEGPTQGGAVGPYRQSERTAIYQQYITQLVAAGHAYYAFDTPEELDAMRQRLKSARIAAPQYNAISRGWMKNSLVLPREEVNKLLQANIPYVIRIKIPHQEAIRFHDLIRGWVKITTSSIDDKVLMKSDGIPTYHFANVVDDYLMGITHVIRGEEWIPSTPLHVLLYRYLGWEKVMPQFAHLPLLLKPEGTGKLSKRDADKEGFPILPLAWQDPETGENMPGFREQGYLSDALLNFLALLGWHPGQHQDEVLNQAELIRAFSIERIGKSGIRFDIHKAKWLNQQYLRDKPEHVLVAYLTQDLQAHKIAYTQEKALQVCRLLKERVVFPQDFWLQGKYFFQAPTGYDEQILQKKWNKQVYTALQAFVTMCKTTTAFNFDVVFVRDTLQRVAVAYDLKIGQLMPVLRIALTGGKAGPDLLQSMALLGRETCMARIVTFLQRHPCQ